MFRRSLEAVVRERGSAAPVKAMEDPRGSLYSGWGAPMTRILRTILSQSAWTTSRSMFNVIASAAARSRRDRAAADELVLQATLHSLRVAGRRGLDVVRGLSGAVKESG